ECWPNRPRASRFENQKREACISCEDRGTVLAVRIQSHTSKTGNAKSLAHRYRCHLPEMGGPNRSHCREGGNQSAHSAFPNTFEVDSRLRGNDGSSERDPIPNDT